MSATGYALTAVVVAAGVGLLSGWIPKPARLPVGTVVFVVIVLVVIQFVVGQHTPGTGAPGQQPAASAAPGPTSAVSPTASSALEVAPASEVTTTTDTPTRTSAALPAQPTASSGEDLLELSIQWTAANRHDVDGRVTFQPTGTSEAEEAYAAQLANPDGSYAYPPDCFVTTQVDTTAGALVKNYISEPCNGGQINLGVLGVGDYVLVVKARWTGGSKTAKSPFSVLS
jgi:hypothetical protein